MSTKLEVFKNYLKKYAAGYQEKHELPSDSPVTLIFQANNTQVTFIYLETAYATEPDPMVIGQYWFDGTLLRKCISNAPGVGDQLNTYTISNNWTDIFQTSVQLIGEAIDTSEGGTSIPPPDPIGKGSLIVNDGGENQHLAVGSNGTGLVSDSDAPLGLDWKPILTETGTQTLSNKTLSSPSINGFVEGSAILDEDDMATNSPKKLASQQSIRSYVEAQITALSGGVFLSATPGWAANSGALPSGTLKGELFFVTVAASMGATTFNVGDMLVSKLNAASTSDLNDWLVLNTGPIDPSILLQSHIIDEDDMVSDSDTQVPTQQSVKAFIEAQVAAVAGAGIELADTPEWDASTGTFPAGASKGNLFFCTVEGDVGGTIFRVGDSLVAKIDAADINTAADWVAITTSNAAALSQLDLIDEDDLVSDSDTKIPTQQSVKSYVDGKNRIFPLIGRFYTDGREALVDALVLDGVVPFDGFIVATSVRAKDAFSAAEFDASKTCTLEVTKNGVKLVAVALDITLDDTDDAITGQTPRQAHKNISYDTAGYQVSAGDRVGIMVTTNGVDFASTLDVSVYVKLDASQ